MTKVILNTFVISILFVSTAMAQSIGTPLSITKAKKVLKRGVDCDPGLNQIVVCNNTSHDWVAGSARIMWKAKLGGYTGTAPCDGTPVKEKGIFPGAPAFLSTTVTQCSVAPATCCQKIPVVCKHHQKCRAKVGLY